MFFISYEFCSTPPEEFVGGMVILRVNGVCREVIFDGVRGNPIIKFDEDHLYLAGSVIALHPDVTTSVMAQFFGGDTQIKQLTSDINDSNCPEGITGSPERLTLGFDGVSYWIHTPSFDLVGNDVMSPILDGGKSAVEATANAKDDRLKVKCSNVPRTFLNEDYCILAQNACPASDRSGTNGSVVVCGSPFEVANKHSPDSGTLHRGGFDLRTHYNLTKPQEFLTAQRETVWLEIALHGEDQLRQRVAWALSQLIVVSPNAIASVQQSESFLTFYDIFGKFRSNI
jgi:hypothetical protein